MTDLLLDETRDLVLEANDVVLVTGTAEVAQRLRQRLRTFLGEWFLDTSIGVPYFQVIFQRGVSAERIASHFKREILETPGVAELLSYNQSIDSATRRLSVEARCRAANGDEIAISEVLI